MQTEFNSNVVVDKVPQPQTQVSPALLSSHG